MNVEFYLVVNERGSVRTVKNKPGLDWNEVAIKLDLKLPDALFEKPHLSASINVGDDAVNTPNIEADVVSNIEQSILEHTGVEVKLSIVNPENE